jgi:branched-chain amino acid transport system permease protein
VTMVVLGGTGSITGSVLAAIVLTLLPEVLRPLAAYRLVLYALLLIILMLTRPQGIFGSREISLAGLFPRRRKELEAPLT